VHNRMAAARYYRAVAVNAIAVHTKLICRGGFVVESPRSADNLAILRG
jgi:hypothetical protein